MDNQAHRAVEGKAPSGFAGGGGDASPYNQRTRIPTAKARDVFDGRGEMAMRNAMSLRGLLRAKRGKPYYRSTWQSSLFRKLGGVAGLLRSARNDVSMVFLVTLIVNTCSCGEGGLYTTVPTTSSSISTNDVATTKQFALGSDYPAGLVISEIAGLQSTAFVVSVESPVGVIAVDLDSNPLRLSKTHAGCLLPPGTGIPTGALQVLTPTKALLLTSSHLIYCNPRSGSIITTLPLDVPITLPSPLPLSRPYDADGDGTLETSITTFRPTFPGGIATDGTIIYISFGNYLQPIGMPVAAPGTILRYHFLTQSPYLARSSQPPMVTSAYNPTGLHLLNDGRLLIVNSGVNTVANGGTMPQTTSSLDIFDTTNNTLTSLALGPVALAFTTPTVTRDERTLFLTSASYGEMYVVDLWQQTMIRDHSNPVVITSSDVGSDFLPSTALDASGAFLFVASFTQSAIYPVEIGATTFTPLPPAHAAPLVLGHAPGVTSDNPSGAITGVGAVAFRPGQRTIDYAGPNFFALTANPGMLIGLTVEEGVATVIPTIAIEEETTPTPEPADVAAPLPDPNVSATPDPASPQPPPSGNAGINPYNPGYGSCLPFADAVVDFLPGSGAGWGTQYFPNNVLGPPNGKDAAVPTTSQKDLLSLGCGGEIILAMTAFWIVDGPGADFIVFENAFYPTGADVPFAEPAEVAVSWDGSTWHTFPCGDAGNGYAGCAGVHPTLSQAGSDAAPCTPANGRDPTDPQTAGGDAFDLSDVNIDKARYIKIRDVSCGAGSGTTSGFELDAVSIHWGMIPN